MTRLQKHCFEKVSRAILEEEGLELSLHHTFLVQYKREEDLGLDMHTDDSDVTFNVCLGRGCTGGDLVFCGKIGAPDHRRHKLSYVHVKEGSCVCASGSTVARSCQHRHGRAGELDPQESGAPNRNCMSRTHDRDFGLYEGARSSTSSSSTSTSHPAHLTRTLNHAAHNGGGSGMRSEGWWRPSPAKEHQGSPLVRLHAQQQC